MLFDLVRGRRVAVLTGAGCSTESGIPDYRGAGTRARARNPVQFRQFMNDASARARYWSRSALGWPRLSQALPNAAHVALAALEREGIVTGIITQNVDRLHNKAGSRRVIELHGAAAEVKCTVCETIVDRSAIQSELVSRNPGLLDQVAESAPDGDADVEPAGAPAQNVAVPTCAQCNGMLKPHMVFFGETVPKHRVDSAWSLLEESDVLLVVGSSLTVFSGFRFVRGAHQRDLPIAIVNLTETRGDRLATICVRAAAGETLAHLRQDFKSRSGSSRADN